MSPGDSFVNYGALFGLSDARDMGAVITYSTVPGCTYTRFKQHHVVIPIAGGEVVLTHTTG
jgi:hypothetical protein